MRWASRTDGNHTEVVMGLRSAGCSVMSLAALGGLKPDLLVARWGVNLLVELKRPGYKAPTRAQRERREAQAEFRSGWQGPSMEASTASEVLEELNRLAHLDGGELEGGG